ncbi:hypothetical protein P8452_61538 [Trifolium repens]|nr:hypothetical protein P8452_61538 [Trifolium repens]
MYCNACLMILQEDNDLNFGFTTETFVGNGYELYCFLSCLAFLDASLLVMIEEFAIIWPNLVENYVFVAVNLGCKI